MDTIATPRRWAAPRAAEAVALSRPQVLALVLLTCVPIPLLSLAATVVPLPEILERAAATFVPFVAPTLGEDEGRVARESASAVHTLGIVHRPSEQSASSLAPRTASTRSGGSTRGARGELDSPFAPEGNPSTQPGKWTPDSTPTGGPGGQGESPPSGADPTIPPAEGPSDAPTGGNTGGSPAPSGSGDTPSGDAPGQTSSHGKAGSPPGQGDKEPPSDPGGGNSGGSGNGSGQGPPAKSEPPAGGGASPGAGGGGR